MDFAEQAPVNFVFSSGVLLNYGLRVDIFGGEFLEPVASPCSDLAAYLSYLRLYLYIIRSGFQNSIGSGASRLHCFLFELVL